MKIRNGFVSNSSSSSFVILLPKNFDINTIDFEAELEKCEYDETDAERVKEAMEEFIKNGELWEQESYEEVDIIHNILKKYVVTSFDGGPDDGKIVLLNTKKVYKILGIDETTGTV
jgi:hypothetical protein